jgi:putative ABC transport system permease protein
MLNVIMIAGAVSGIIVFRGFTKHIQLALREGLIQSDLGHAQLAKQSFWNNKFEKQKDILIENYQEIEKELKSNPQVLSVAGRSSFFGLVSTGDKSTSAKGIGFNLLNETIVIEQFHVISGEKLSDPNGFEILVGKGVANKIGIKANNSITILAHTYDGVVNALDVKVTGLFETGMAEVDNFVFILPIGLLLRLLDTNAVEKIVINLKKTDDAESYFNNIKEKYLDKWPGLEFKHWESLAPFYNDVKEFWKVNNGIIETIVLLVVAIGILNTIGMSVMERTGEIGILRSLGEEKWTLIYQFVLEGMILGVIGVIFGIVLAQIGIGIFEVIDYKITVPTATVKFAVKIEAETVDYFRGCFIGFTASVLAALIPSFKAANLNIVDAIRRNI